MDRTIFGEEHDMFRDSVRGFLLNEVQPHGERWREQGIVDREAYLKAGEQGLLLMWADEKYGARRRSAIFATSRSSWKNWPKHGDGGFLHDVAQPAGRAPTSASFGTDEQKAALVAEVRERRA